MKNLGKSIAALSFLLLASMPASAQFGVQIQIPLPGVEIRVGHTAPPRLRSERRPHRPGRDYVWLRGSWDWHENAWAWVPGRWDRPNRRHTYWVKARYAREGNAWRYEPAHWSDQRMVESEDYRQWKHDRGNHGNRNRGHDQHGRRD